MKLRLAILVVLCLSPARAGDEPTSVKFDTTQLKAEREGPLCYTYDAGANQFLIYPCNGVKTGDPAPWPLVRRYAPIH